MDKQTISFRLDTEKIAELDALASAMERDRTQLLTEAVDAYLDLQRRQVEQILAGIADAEAGRLIDHHRVKRMVSNWRRRR